MEKCWSLNVNLLPIVLKAKNIHKSTELNKTLLTQLLVKKSPCLSAATALILIALWTQPTVIKPMLTISPTQKLMEMAPILSVKMIWENLSLKKGMRLKTSLKITSRLSFHSYLKIQLWSRKCFQRKEVSSHHAKSTCLWITSDRKGKIELTLLAGWKRYG